VVIYQFVRGPDGLPTLVRNQKSPGTEAPGLSLTPIPGATPKEDDLVTTASNRQYQGLWCTLYPT
jgi:hypothetical protein